jgi:hypothetical protein
MRSRPQLEVFHKLRLPLVLFTFNDYGVVVGQQTAHVKNVMPLGADAQVNARRHRQHGVPPFTAAAPRGRRRPSNPTTSTTTRGPRRLPRWSAFAWGASAGAWGAVRLRRAWGAFRLRRAWVSPEWAGSRAPPGWGSLPSSGWQRENRKRSAPEP